MSTTKSLFSPVSGKGPFEQGQAERHGLQSGRLGVEPREPRAQFVGCDRAALGEVDQPGSPRGDVAPFVDVGGLRL